MISCALLGSDLSQKGVWHGAYRESCGPCRNGPFAVELFGRVPLFRRGVVRPRSCTHRSVSMRCGKRGVGIGEGTADRGGCCRPCRSGDADPALCRPHEIAFPGHDRQRAGAAVFQSGAAVVLRLQPFGRGPVIPGGAAPRSRLRDVLVGRSAGARPQYQRADGRAGSRGGAGCDGSRHGAACQCIADGTRADRGCRLALFARSRGRPGKARCRLCRRDVGRCATFPGG